ncbi:hypothetical protein PANA5342_0562 [Pantoea ananatis LMG 5342]|nr:hypothetical protein PANA5342_0562 [Pantoea ananatis LMG 5342]
MLFASFVTADQQPGFLFIPHLPPFLCDIPFLTHCLIC